MATSKRKTANEPVTTAAAEPSSDDRDSEIARRAAPTATNGAAALTDTISINWLRRN